MNKPKITPDQFECCISRKHQAGNSTDGAFDVLIKGMSYKNAAELNGVSQTAIRKRVCTIMAKHKIFLAAYGQHHAQP